MDNLIRGDLPGTCADQAASYYDLELPPVVQPRYDAIRHARISAHTLIEAQAWLRQRGLLDRVPRYEAGVTDDVEFTRQLEDLCGPRAKGAFQSEYGFHVLSPTWVMSNLGSFEEDQEVFPCLMQVAQVAGFEISFIGNAKYSEKD